jgi:hypothetical protein
MIRGTDAVHDRKFNSSLVIPGALGTSANGDLQEGDLQTELFQCRISASTTDDASADSYSTLDEEDVTLEMKAEERSEVLTSVGSVDRKLEASKKAQKEELFVSYRGDSLGTRGRPVTLVGHRTVCGDADSCPGEMPDCTTLQALPPGNSETNGIEKASGARVWTDHYRHNEVPKVTDFLVHRNPSSDQPPTTIMLRNIPNRYTQRDLIEELEDLGFKDKFDFLYLPVDKGTLSSVGYAFINFVCPFSAERCTQVFNGYSFRPLNNSKTKVASTSVAHLQGLDANLAHYEKSAISSVKSKQRRPWVMTSKFREEW